MSGAEEVSHINIKLIIHGHGVAGSLVEFFRFRDSKFHPDGKGSDGFPPGRIRRLQDLGKSLFCYIGRLVNFAVLQAALFNHLNKYIAKTPGISLKHLFQGSGIIPFLCTALLIFQIIKPGGKPPAMGRDPVRGLLCQKSSLQSCMEDSAADCHITF